MSNVRDWAIFAQGTGAGFAVAAAVGMFGISGLIYLLPIALVVGGSGMFAETWVSAGG